MFIITTWQGDAKREGNEVHGRGKVSRVERHVFVSEKEVTILLDKQWEVIRFTESELKTLLDEMEGQKEKCGAGG